MRRAESYRGRLIALAGALTMAAASSAVAVQTQADLPPASDVVARYVEAIGGRDAILSHESRYVEFFFKGPFAEAEFTVYAAKPDKTYMRWEFGGVVSSETGFDGEVGWSVERDLGPRLLLGKELDRARKEADFYADLYDPTSFESMETVELLEFEGSECYKLKLVWKSGREAFEYFDVETGLKMGSEGKNRSGNYLIESSEILSDYEDFGGVLMPSKRIWRYKGWQYEQVVTVQTVELDAVPDSVFAAPPELAGDPWPVATAIADALELEPGDVVADVGAGAGLLSIELGRRVGPTGQVLATEIDTDFLDEIRAQATYEGLKNVTPVLGDQSYTGLPKDCCDGILLRFVYHEFEEPQVMNADMLRALTPGGLVLVIDDRAEGDSLVDGRGNHTILPEVLIEEMEAAGFELLQRQDNWDDRESRFAVVLRRPL